MSKHKCKRDAEDGTNVDKNAHVILLLSVHVKPIP